MKDIIKKVQGINSSKKALPKNYQGFIDNHWGPNIRGWALDKNNLDKQVWVRVTAPGVDKIVLANEFRRDIKEKMLHPTGNCGFSLRLSKALQEPAHVSVIEQAVELSSSRPFYSGKKLFFMHIAKTAGSSVNEQIAGNFPEKDINFHIEGVNDWNELKDRKIVSGHIPLKRFYDFFEISDYVCFSFLRKPIDQLISHIYWVRHLSEPGVEGFKASHPPIVQKLSEKLMEIDFKDKEQVKKWVDNITLVEAPLFDNCQSRYFHPIEAKRRYTPGACQKAIAAMHKVQIIGITEQYKKSMNYLASVMGWTLKEDKPVHINVNRYSYGIDKENEDIREILSPLIQFDDLLYQAALDKFHKQVN